MKFRATAIASAFAAVLLAAALPAAADVAVSLNFGPPAVVYEPVPPPRAGYVWAPGYWDYNKNHRKHVWRKGHWERERHGRHYVHGGWQHRNGRWDLHRGYWAVN